MEIGNKLVFTYVLEVVIVFFFLIMDILKINFDPSQ